MSGHNRRQIGRSIFFWTAAGVFAADQITKIAARSFLLPSLSVEIIPGFFSLSLVENPGGAFGLFGAWPLLLIVTAAAAVIVIVLLRDSASKSSLLSISLGSLLGGACGNLADRLFIGRVTDFLDFGITLGGKPYHWPTFNFADIGITLGVLALIYHSFLVERREIERKT